MDLDRVPGLKPEHRAYFDDAGVFAGLRADSFLQRLDMLVGTGFIQVPAALMMPHYYRRRPDELLAWLEAIDAHANLKSAFDPNIRGALATYQRHNVPIEYLEVIKAKRHPVRGAAQIAGYWSYGISAEYAAVCDWGFKTDIIKQFQDMGIPAEWTQRLNYMSNQPEWVEVYWQSGMDLDYATELWKTNFQPVTNCGHHSIVACWEAEVPLEYALATAPWLAPEDVVAGWEAGIPAEYLLQTLRP